MTTNEFFTAFADFLSEDKVTEPYAKSFKKHLMEPKLEGAIGELFTRTGYRVAMIFFEQYGKEHKEFENPGCHKAKVNWNNRNIEKIKQRLAKEYDTVMYVGKENCDNDCNFAVFDENVDTAIQLFGGIEAFLDNLEQ